MYFLHSRLCAGCIYRPGYLLDGIERSHACHGGQVLNTVEGAYMMYLAFNAVAILALVRTGRQDRSL